MKNIGVPLLVGLGGAALLLGFFFYSTQRPSSAPTTTTTPQASSTSATSSASGTVKLGGGVKVPASGEGVTLLPIENAAAKAPVLKSSYPVLVTMEPAQKDALQKKIDTAVASLRGDKEQLRVWTELGGYLKVAGNYTDARDAWEYVATAAPSNYVALNNLGDLYMNYLKDYPKAELNYKKVIEVKPEYIDTYRNLYTLYTYVYKTDTTAAKDILLLGLSKNPGNSDLTKLLESYNKTHAQ